jgi:rare lipoprotein A
MGSCRFVATALIFVATSTFAAPPVAAPPPPASAPAAAPVASGETGLAAVYSDRLNGHKTASGERYDRNKLTAAHKTLPFGTRVKVMNTRNGKSVEVVINDRGPREANRILDLSPAAAHALGIPRKGIAEVKLGVIPGT